MKFNRLVFAASLCALVLAQEPPIDCVYNTATISGVEHYVCNLEIENPDGFDGFSAIPGEHEAGRGDGDVTFITNYHGSTSVLPRVICAQFPNLQVMNFIQFGLETVTEASLSGCRDLRTFEVFNNRIASLPAGTFVNNGNLTFIDLGENRLESLPESIFASQSELIALELKNNPFVENFAPGTFDSLVNLRMLLIDHCQLTAIDPAWFANLRSLVTLNIYSNFITQLPARAFSGLADLNIVNLNENFIQEVHEQAFEGLRRLQYVLLENNQIADLPRFVFAPFDAIAYVDLRGNRIKTLRRESFGALAALGTLNLDLNVVNALDEAILEEATSLYWLYFGSNLCASGLFSNFNANRAAFMPRLSRCFRNFEFTVETSTDVDLDYQFHAAPEPGIQLRVLSQDVVHIALTPFNFPWTPMLEIFIGTANNTRSVIRRNQETDVVVVPTPGILIDGIWNGFRVTWANHILLVTREGDSFPFLAFTMQDFFNVNFYGLRTPESRASWIIQPVDAETQGIVPIAAENV